MNAEEKGMELAHKGGNYSPITVTNNDTMGTLVLGVVSIALLIALVCSRRRISKLEKELQANRDWEKQ